MGWWRCAEGRSGIVCVVCGTRRIGGRGDTHQLQSCVTEASTEIARARVCVCARVRAPASSRVLWLCAVCDVAYAFSRFSRLPGRVLGRAWMKSGNRTQDSIGHFPSFHIKGNLGVCLSHHTDEAKPPSCTSARAEGSVATAGHGGIARRDPRGAQGLLQIP